MEGKIIAYSSLAEYTYDYVTAVQQHEGAPILPLRKETLRLMVGDDPKILALIDRGKLIRALKAYNWKNRTD
jgi:hypothetical protein